jgi:hypothetical protein
MVFRTLFTTKGAGVGKTARNEQKKLRATAFNSLGIGIAMAGIYVPMLGFYFGGLKSFDPRIILPVAVLAAIIAFFFHRAGVGALADLED